MCFSQVIEVLLEPLETAEPGAGVFPIPSTHLLCILNETPGLLFDTGHVGFWRVNQRRHLRRTYKAVLLHRPTKVQTRGVQVRVHWPVCIWRAVCSQGPLVIGELGYSRALVRGLNCSLDMLNLRLCEKVHHVWGLKEFIVALKRNIESLNISWHSVNNQVDMHFSVCIVFGIPMPTYNNTVYCILHTIICRLDVFLSAIPVPTCKSSSSTRASMARRYSSR